MVHAVSQEERTRLEQVYAEMTEGELRSIAKDGASLTSEAVKALRAEISHRGVDIALTTHKPVPQTEFTTRHGLTMLAIFAGLGLAFILLVLSFPQWFAGCVSGLDVRRWW